MIMVDLISMVFRLAELAFAAIVAGINGAYLHSVRHSSSWSQGRFIYTEVVAAISIFFAIVWLFPFSGSFIHWPMDLFLSICWFVAFGLLVNFIGDDCGYVFNWSNVGFDGTNTCANWKADIAFCFLSAIVWLASTILGLYWIHRQEQRAAVSTRRRWYRSSRV